MTATTTTVPTTGADGDKAAKKAAKKAGKKPRKKLVLLIVAVLVLVGGGGAAYLLFFRSSSTPAVDPTTVPGSVLTLSPITLNLADGHYLKLTLALQLTESASPAAGSVNAAAATGPAVDGAKALDAAIGVLGKHTYDDLLKPAGREAAQAELSKEVAKRYPGEVLQVYFTEFLMQ